MTRKTLLPGSRQRAWWWSVLVAALIAILLIGVVPGLHLQTNIMALLPSNRADPGVTRATSRFTQQLAQQVIFLVGSKNFDKARQGAETLASDLQQSKLFATVRWSVKAQWLKRANAVYGPYRGGLLAPQTRHWLQSGDDVALLNRARRALYTPAAFMRRSEAQHDLLDLFGTFLQHTTPTAGSKLDLRNGVVTVKDHGLHYVLVNAALRGKAFSASTGERVAPVLRQAVGQARAAGLSVIASGAVFHATAAERESKSQVLRFGVIQGLGLLLLLFWAFRTWRVPILVVATLGVAFVGAFVICHYVFGRVHVLTLVFGCNLAGVAVDYCLYFCADQFRRPGRWHPEDALPAVGGAITVGMFVSVLSYALLATTPFPGLQQMALFCGAGVALAWASVLCWYPRALKPMPGPLAQQRAQAFTRGDEWLGKRIRCVHPVGWGVFTLALLAATITGCVRLQFQDDVSVLQDAPPALVKQDQAVGRLLGGGMDRHFFLIRGENAEAVLERSQALDARLRGAEAAGKLGSFMSLTQALPSARRQASNRHLLATRVYDGHKGLLARFMRELGFPRAAIAKRLAAFDPVAKPLTLDKWLPSKAATPYRHLWLGRIGEGESGAVTTLSGVHAAAFLPRLAAGLPGVTLIDPVGRVSQVLGDYRVRMLWALAAACILVVLLLWLYFRRLRDVFLATTPAVAVLLTLAFFGLAQIAVNLFNVVALLLVLGLGVDYAVFTQRGCRHGYSMLLSVSLAAVASVFAFGLLALSPTPFVRSLGLTVVVGVLISYVLCFVVGKMRS